MNIFKRDLSCSTPFELQQCDSHMSYSTSVSEPKYNTLGIWYPRPSSWLSCYKNKGLCPFESQTDSINLATLISNLSSTKIKSVYGSFLISYYYSWAQNYELTEYFYGPSFEHEQQYFVKEINCDLQYIKWGFIPPWRLNLETINEQLMMRTSLYHKLILSIT